MQGVVKGIYYCQQGRTQDLNDRILERTVPSAPPQMVFDPRPVETRQVLFPMIDCHTQSDTPIIEQPTYTQTDVFNPGTSAPFNGYQTAIDKESQLQRRFFPHQTAYQSKYIPSSNSDMYKLNPMPREQVSKYELPRDPHDELYSTSEHHARETWDQPHPNPFKEIGGDLFYNHTKVQVKNIPC